MIELKKPDVRADVERLADIMMTLQRCLMLRLSEELSRGQVSFPQFFLLGHIATHEFLSMSEIAEKMNHSTAAATGLVDRLENLGYVERSHDLLPMEEQKAWLSIYEKVHSYCLSKQSSCSE